MLGLGTTVNTDPFLVFFGAFYLVLGLSCFFTKRVWEDFIELFVDNDVLSLTMGIMILPIALFIIVFYNNWESLASIVLMVIGYLALLKALVLLMWPNVIQGLLRKEFVKKWLWLDGISGIILGMALLVL